MASAFSPERVVRAALDLLAPAGAIGTTMMIVDPDSPMTAVFAAGVNRHLKRILVPLSIHDHTAGVVAWRERRDVCCSTRAELLQEFPLYGPIDPLVQSLAAFPIGTDDEVLGAMVICFDAERAFDRIDRAMLAAAADVLGELLCPLTIAHRLSTSQQHPTVDCTADDLIAAGPLTLDLHGHQAWVDNQPVGLTKLEFDVLATLLDHRGQVLSKQQLLDLVWGYDGYNPNVVEAQISSLRYKLRTAASLIETVRGLGYVIRRTPAPTPAVHVPAATGGGGGRHRVGLGGMRR